MQTSELTKLAIDALNEIKGLNLEIINVKDLTSITDNMIICTGTSKRHVKALAENVVKIAKESGQTVIGVEGGELAEWILVDLGDVIVHVMQAACRDLYKLEQLWSIKNNTEEETPMERKTNE